VRCALIGPTHPYKGGIAQHTTTLAHELAAAGHEVDLVSWSSQYPAALYPGVQRVEEPEIPVFPHTRYPLAWFRPDSWWRAGRQLRRRSTDLVVFVLVTPIQVPAYLAIMAALTAGRRGCRPMTAVICHNVLPHEPNPGDRQVVRALLRWADVAVVHSDSEAELARQLGTHDVRTRELPPHGPARRSGATPGRGGDGLLFFGFIRPYKGVDLLLRALAQVPDVRLIVAGESWEGEGALRGLVAELGLDDRVELRLRYLPDDELDRLLGAADALVIPYRSGTGTQHVRVAHRHGLPVIASRISTIPKQVDEGVDGFLVEPGDVGDLADAIRRLYEPGRLEKLRAGVRPPDDDLSWRQYVETVTSPRIA
jgi:glycosyltransferase involved in cell wall biosynthesis